MESPRRTRRGRKRLRTRVRAEVRRSCRQKKSAVGILNQSSSSSSSSDSNSESDDQCHKPARRSRSKTSKFDYLLKTPNSGKGKRNFRNEIQPIPVDKSLTFKSIGGLLPQINKLKEIVIFPLLYEEFFSSRGITPPRGVLFHGPPGTGKTLLARTLASEATCVGGREVSVFLRKGADILNKWIGESERQLKLLFEQAIEKQPSIIFFDEIDGLAPMRSNKTDQIYNSVVSTLLAEIDGLKSRGDVIVIGTTNRIDTLDPALRRPGRFDFEIQFLLPSYQARREIFVINLPTFNPPVSQDTLDDLALTTVGYSGADIKLLCCEASFCALRRRYPQIYKSNQKFVLDYDSIKVERCDWEEAKKVVGRSSERSSYGSFFTALPLPKSLHSLLNDTVDVFRQQLKDIFPCELKAISQPSWKSLLVEMGPNHHVLEHVISAGLWDSMDGVPIYILSMQTITTRNNSSDDGGGISQFFSEIRKGNSPSVICIPYMDYLLDSLTQSAQLVLEKEITNMFFHPVLLIAFCGRSSLPEEFKQHFNCLHLLPISTKARVTFFRKILGIVLRIKVDPQDCFEEELPLAPPLPKHVNVKESIRVERAEARVMRELRIFLREIISKLQRNKKFNAFSKPVDIKEVPDYFDVINYPMDLDTMLLKVTQGAYCSAADFLADINLITENCLSYNPTKTDEDREVRHRAHELKDIATSYIELEMDTDFEDLCKEISEKRDQRNSTKTGVNVESAVESPSSSRPNTSLAMPEVEVPSSTSPRPPTKRFKRRGSWAKGINKKPAKRISSCNSGLLNGVSTTSTTHTTSILDESKDRRCSFRRSGSKPLPRSEEVSQSLVKVKVEQKSINECSITCPVNVKQEGPEPDENGYIPFTGGQAMLKEFKVKIKTLYEKCMSITSLFSITELLDLRFKMLALIEIHGKEHEKAELLDKLDKLIDSQRDL